MTEQERWRAYFAAAISAAALFERHNADAMAKRAAEIADAMMRVDSSRWREQPKPAPTTVPSSGSPRRDGSRR